MNLLGLSPVAFAAGLAGLAGTLFVLHMLRVRLRRQRVDSLLFFRQVGAVHKPRVLLGLPARFWSFALGLALLAAAFTTFADPVDAADGPSRSVLVDTSHGVSSTLREELGAAALELARGSGLGPRGRIIAFGEAPRTLWTAGEPADGFTEKLRTLPTGGAPDAFWAGLRAATANLRAGDAVVVLGGPAVLPASHAGVPITRGGFGQRTGAAVVAVQAEQRTDGRHLRVEASSGGGDVEVVARDGADVLASTTLRTAPSTTAWATLGPIDGDEHPGLAVELRAGDTVLTSAPLPLGRSEPARIHLAPGLAACVRAAVEAEPRLELVDGEANADIVVVADLTQDAGANELPRLAFVSGLGDSERAPRTTASNPLPLSLRDRRRAGGSLPPGDGDVWVEDATTGAALVRRSDRGIDAVDWLLEDPTHRDVPALVCGALLALAPGGDMPRWRGGLPPAADSAPAAGIGAVADPFPWAMVLLACALAALFADGWLHHRGRVA
jgi:hypothetical protein